MVISLLMSLAMAASNDPASTTACHTDDAAALALSPQAFDQDRKLGWRGLADMPGCYGAAADLIAAYRKAHWDQLKSNLNDSYWHEGQMRAAAGQYPEAKRLLMAGVSPTSFGDFEDYALGTIAFLDHDMEALKAARARLAATPEPPDFLETAKTYNIKWPLNLEILDGLNACFDKPYSIAYACRANSSQAPAPPPKPASP